MILRCSSRLFSRITPAPPNATHWMKAFQASEGYCQLVELQTQFTWDERCFQRLGCLLDARHLLPSDKGLRADRPGVGGGQEMPTIAKQIVDGSVGR